MSAIELDRSPAPTNGALGKSISNRLDEIEATLSLVKQIQDRYPDLIDGALRAVNELRDITKGAK